MDFLKLLRWKSIPLKKPRSCILLLMGLVVSGCISVEPISPKATTFDLPRLNEIAERELGDTLIDKGTIRSYEAIIITEPVVGHWGIGPKLRVAPGTFVATGKTRLGVLYWAPAPIHWDAPLGSSLHDGGIVIPNSPTDSPYIFVRVGNETRRSRPLKDLPFKKTVSDRVLPGSFRQELIYNGKAGESIKFLYREIKDSYVRAPFTQEVTYDLKEGDVVGFKGARLKVIEATNTKIKYQVTKTFD